MSSLFAELRRRNVFKVGAAYAIVAWLLLQITDIVLPTFNAPQWIAQTITFVLAIGFPIAVILAWAFDVTPQGIKTAAEIGSGDAPVQATGLRFGYVMQTLILLAVGFLVVDQYLLEPNTDAPSTTSPGFESTNAVRRLQIPLGRAEPRGNAGTLIDVAISPDGQRVAYVIQRNGSAPLYIRELNELTSREVPGTDDASDLFFSPDGMSLAFNGGGGGGAALTELRQVSVLGGQPRTVAADMREDMGGHWTPDGQIYYTARVPEGLFRLHRIPESGGEPELLETDTNIADLTHGWADVLPGGEHVLFATRPNDGDVRDGPTRILTIASGETRVVAENAYAARYVPSGHIVFMRTGSLWAVPFDLESLEVVGREVPVVNGVHSGRGRGATAYSFSANALLVYLPGPDRGYIGNLETLVWLNRDGSEEVIGLEPDRYNDLSLSPDGRSLAVTQPNANEKFDVWIHDLEGGAPFRLTSAPGDNRFPAWTPDGQYIVFDSRRSDGGLFRTLANGAGEEERLTRSAISQIPNSFSPDGDVLVFHEGTGGADRSLHTLSLEGDRTPEVLLQTAFFELNGVVAPNGRVLAYESSESGVFEIYVRPYPDVQADRWPISSAGGRWPRWSADGSELLFVSATGSIMVAAVESYEPFEIGSPEVLLERGIETRDGQSFDVSPDGQRFLFTREVDDGNAVSEQTTLVVVENWFEELRRLAPRDSAETP